MLGHFKCLHTLSLVCGLVVPYIYTLLQGLSQDSEAGVPRLAIVNFKASYFSREMAKYSGYNLKHVFPY